MLESERVEDGRTGGKTGGGGDGRVLPGGKSVEKEAGEERDRVRGRRSQFAVVACRTGVDQTPITTSSISHHCDGMAALAVNQRYLGANRDL